MGQATTSSEVVALPLPRGAKETAIRAKIREAIELTIEATQTREAAGEQAAVEIAAELALEECWIAVTIVATAWLCEKRFYVIADDCIENGLLGLTPAVARTCERRARGARMALVPNPARRRIRTAIGIDHIRRSGSGSVPWSSPP